MAEPKSSDTNDRLWHFVWAIAGVGALTYGIVGIVAQIIEPNRHPLALPWFIVATVGGLSMMSFIWRSGD